MNRREQILQTIETVALNAGAIDSALELGPLDTKISRQLIRGRRLRVLDWLSQSGLRVLNVISDINERFLNFCIHNDLLDKYDVAVAFANDASAFDTLQSGPMLAELAKFEAYMVLSRRDRETGTLPTSDSIRVKLSSGVYLHQNPQWTLAAHDLLPDYSVGQEAARKLLHSVISLAEGSDNSLASYVSLESTEAAPGFTAEIEADTYSVLLSMTHSAIPIETCQSQLPKDVYDELNSVGAFTYE